MAPLRLTLVPRLMDARLLSCLVVHHGTAFTAELRGRDARVAALQAQLLARISSATSPTDLSLFLARRIDDNDRWLVNTGEDAIALALGEDTTEGDAAVARFLVPTRQMHANELVRTYFPEQPPLFDGTESTIHVLVRVGHAVDVAITMPCVTVSSEPPPRNWTAQLVASLARVRLEEMRVKLKLKAAAFPMVVRCTNGRGMLWLHDDDEINDPRRAKASYYVPSAWRELSSEIFAMVLHTESKKRPVVFTGDLKGRRAIITGAPRVGKSVFMAFMLLQLLRLRSPPVCIVDVPGVTFARIDLARGRVDEGARDVHFRDELSDIRSVYLFDVSPAMDELVGPLSARVVHARSIIMRPNHFVPRVAGGGKRTMSFALPLWSLGDVQVCARRCYPPLRNPTVIDLYFKWGGIPGRIVDADAIESERALEAALARVNGRKLKMAFASVADTGLWIVTAEREGSSAWHPLVVAVPSAHTRGHFTGDVSFTSQYVCDRVLARSSQRTRVWKALATLQQPALWAQVRTSLEYLAQEEEEKHADAPAMTSASSAAWSSWESPWRREAAWE